MLTWIPNFISQTPCDAQLKKIIISSIQRGELKKGELLPSKDELYRYSQASKVFIGKAYRELRQIGVLSYRKGKGYFVK
jgi:DNA-binding GntR family transcriptional regulator